MRVEVEGPVVEPADRSIVLVPVSVSVVVWVRGGSQERSLVLLADGPHDVSLWSSVSLALDRPTRFGGGRLLLLEVIVVLFLLFSLFLVVLEVVVVLRRVRIGVGVSVMGVQEF